MRILHTSDWHLGKSIHGQNLLKDQKYILEQLVEELSRGYDGLLICGDVYDRAIPPSEAVELFSGFIEKMVDLGITTVIIPGNHDSPSRLDFASGILERSGIHFRCRYDRITDPIIMEDDEGEQVQIFALPFVDEVVVKALYPERGIRTHQEATNFLLDRIREAKDPSIPSILMAHTYTGREPLRSESERELLVGAEGMVDINMFKGFDHVALGHLHRPQVASRTGSVHYSGSLITYSFSEFDHSKSSMILEVIDGKLSRSNFPHVLLRKFSRISGKLDEILLSDEFQRFRDNYLSVVLTDKGYLVDIHRKLRERFPHILEIDQPALHLDTSCISRLTREQTEDPQLLFSLFLDRFGWEDKEEKEFALKMFMDIRRNLQNEDREAV